LPNCQALRTRRVASRASACQIVIQTPATPKAGPPGSLGEAKSMIFSPIPSRLSPGPGLSMKYRDHQRRFVKLKEINTVLSCDEAGSTSTLRLTNEPDRRDRLGTKSAEDRRCAQTFLGSKE
jgi:hypothetical protein